MWRDITNSFARGMRCGLLLAGSTLALTVLMAVFAYTATADSTEGGQAVAAATLPDAPVDRHLLAATSRRAPKLADDENPAQRVGDLAFGLSVESSGEATPDLDPTADEPVLPVPTPTPTPTPAAPPPAPTAAPTAVATTVAPPPPPVAVILPSGELYERIAAAFPEEPERAYAVAICESSGNAAINTGNGYYGLWQFDLPTWQSVGGSGLPSDASIDEQIERARMLYESRGWSPWGCA